MTNDFWRLVFAFFIDFIEASWDIFRSASVYMLFGFFIAGVLYVFVRAEKIGAILGKGRFRPVLLSALIGVPLPLCSCGVVPAAAGLRKQGASKGATLSFLISTPETGIDSIAVTYALLDPLMTILRPLAAFFSAMTAGIVESIFGRNDLPLAPTLRFSGCGCTDNNCETSNHTWPQKLGQNRKSDHLRFTLKKFSSGMSYAFGELLGDVGKWFVIGVLIAGGITFLIPESLLATVSQNRMAAMVLAMAAGIPMYVCATSSTPIAAALILKGLNPGAALVFLLLGPATNIASLSMIYGLLGKRSLFIYLGSMVGCALLFGFIVDGLYAMFDLSPIAVAGQASEIMPNVIEIGASVILGALLIYSIARPHLSGPKITEPADCATFSEGCR